jgi:hypothetical protein
MSEPAMKQPRAARPAGGLSTLDRLPRPAPAAGDRLLRCKLRVRVVRASRA